MLHRSSLFACLMSLTLAPSVLAQSPQLTERTYTRLRDYVLPSREEDSWRNVDWKSSFWDAVIEAQDGEGRAGADAVQDEAEREVREGRVERLRTEIVFAA